MYTYTAGTGLVTRDSDSKVVAPCDSHEDADFVAYNAWASEGNFPSLIEAPEPVVTTVTPRQMRQALTRLGLRDTVEAAVAQASRDTQDAWEFSLEVGRYEPMVIGMSMALGVTSTDMNNLFKLASTL